MEPHDKQCSWPQRCLLATPTRDAGKGIRVRRLHHSKVRRTLTHLGPLTTAGTLGQERWSQILAGLLPGLPGLRGP